MQHATNEVGIGELVFYGSQKQPFLAPRGICLIKNRLFVADTGQNRVFCWYDLPTEEYQDPDVVIGQADQAATGRNRNGQVGAGTLQYPSGIWSDGKQLIVADAWNHRVLIWHELPQSNGQTADVVIGQPDFVGNQPNVYGIGSSISARSLNWPYGVYSDGQSLWVADTGNRRVLYYRQIPTVNFVEADGVIGQANFEDRDYDPQHAIWPYSVKLSADGYLAITDTQAFRTLIWRDWQTAFSQSADVIIGQPSLEANGQNQYGWKPGPNTLNWCYDSYFHKNGIWVADTGNSRLLWYSQIPKQNNSWADDLIGQDDFETGSENKNTVAGTDGSLYWPFALSIDERTMAIADTGNHRVVLHRINSSID